MNHLIYRNPQPFPIFLHLHHFLRSLSILSVLHNFINSLIEAILVDFFSGITFNLKTFYTSSNILLFLHQVCHFVSHLKNYDMHSQNFMLLQPAFAFLTGPPQQLVPLYF